MAAPFKIDKLLVIGVGLIGGSVALALRKAGVVGEIVGAGRSLENLEKAVQLNVIDRFTDDLAQEVEGSDFIVLSTPVLATDETIRTIAKQDYHNACITDVGSVKGCIVESAQQHLDPGYQGFVAAHPIAGREHSGVGAATDDLFVGKRTIITPSHLSSLEAIEKVRKLWLATGSRVIEMDPFTHDDLISASSHLPHLVAFGLVNYIANHKRGKECFDLAASGFYDFTRIASSDSTMWRDISLANANAIVRELKGYIENLELIASEISNGNGERLQEIMEIAKESRDHYLAQWTK